MWKDVKKMPADLLTKIGLAIFFSEKLECFLTGRVTVSGLFWMKGFLCHSY